MSFERAAEDVAATNPNLELTDTAIVSIAISLKRIADVMTKVPVVAAMTPEEVKELKQKWEANLK